MKNVTILALPGTLLTSIAAPSDVFYASCTLWNQIKGIDPHPFFNVKIVTLDGKPVECRNRIRIIPHKAMNMVKKSDLIVISAISDMQNTWEEALKAVSWLKGQYSNGAHVASICTGAFLLAETGLLDGKEATTHWAMAELFMQRYPEIRLKPERMITDEGDIFCSAGANAGFDLSLYLVAKYCGPETAIQCARVLVQDFGRNSQAPYRAFSFVKNHEDDQILAVQKLLEKEYDKNINVDDLASRVGMSRRTLERKFKSATGDTPLHYLQCVRVEAAKRMIETGQYSFEEITKQVGYEDSSSFRKVFVKEAGLTPSSYRSRFHFERRNGL